jgi:hypothetical protein
MRVSFGHTGSADRTGEGWDFEVGFEPTRFDKSKYVLNADTGDVLGVVGKDFNCVSHAEFFEGIEDGFLMGSDQLQLVPSPVVRVPGLCVNGRSRVCNP